MTLADCAKEMIDMWQTAINEERELTPDEKQYLLDLQERTIKKEQESNDGLTEEELRYENIANHQIDYFKDRDGMKN